MAYVQTIGVPRNNLFDRTQAKQGIFDSSQSISNLQQYLLQNEISSEIKEGFLEAKLGETPFKISFQPQGYTGAGYMVASVQSSNLNDATRIRRLLKGMQA